MPTTSDPGRRPRWVALLAADDVEAAVRFLYQGDGAGSLGASPSSLRASSRSTSRRRRCGRSRLG
jgi:hypothetical protein